MSNNVGNFGDSADEQLRRRLDSVPLPNYTESSKPAMEKAPEVSYGDSDASSGGTGISSGDSAAPAQEPKYADLCNGDAAIFPKTMQMKPEWNAIPAQEPVATVIVHNTAGECRIQSDRLCPELPIGMHSLYATPAPTAAPVLCSHRLADARNQVIKSGYACIDCGAVFAAAQAAPAVPVSDEQINPRDGWAVHVEVDAEFLPTDDAPTASLAAAQPKEAGEMTPGLAEHLAGLHARIAELEDAPAVPDEIERIAQEWDGCMFESVGEDIDIGAAIRRAGKIA